MNIQFPARWLVAGSILLSLAAVNVSAQITAASSPAPTSAPIAATSPGVSDIVKMLDANVSKDVIKTYVETSTSLAAPSADDLIILKNHGATDEITVALMKHTAPAAPAATQAPAAASTGNNESTALLQAYIAGSRSSSSRLDPEGYDYFQHYYLYPRTLANVNQTLGYNAAYYGFGGNPSVPYGFGPRFNLNRGPFQSGSLR